MLFAASTATPRTDPESPPPLYPAALESAVPVLENALSVAFPFPTQTLPYVSTASEPGAFNPPPWNPPVGEKVAPSGLSSVRLFAAELVTHRSPLPSNANPVGSVAEVPRPPPEYVTA